jgi:AcrR family transcriptional regulator
VSGAPIIDRRAERRQSTIDEIVGAAWSLARERGLAGISLRDVGERVGMRAQSLYTYFGSKLDIYDAMFRGGYEELVGHMALLDREELLADPAVGLRRGARHFFEFCTSDPARYQLLFQRTVPDFVPSDASWAVAVAYLEGVRSDLAAIGIDDPADLDLWTALITGLTDQQLSNDPGGDRWARQLDRVVDVFLREVAPRHLRTPSPRTKGRRR